MSLKKHTKILKTLIVVLTLILVGTLFPTDNASAAVKVGQVTNLKALTFSDHAVDLSWNKTKNAKKYEIYRSTSLNGTYTKVATTSNRTYICKNLKENKKYYFKVRGINGYKKGLFSTKKYATTLTSDLQTEVQWSVSYLKRNLKYPETLKIHDFYVAKLIGESEKKPVISYSAENDFSMRVRGYWSVFERIESSWILARYQTISPKVINYY